MTNTIVSRRFEKEIDDIDLTNVLRKKTNC